MSTSRPRRRSRKRKCTPPAKDVSDQATPGPVEVDPANPARPALRAACRLLDACPLGGDSDRDFLILPRLELPPQTGPINTITEVGPDARVLDVVWERGLLDDLYRPATIEEGNDTTLPPRYGFLSHTHAELEVDGRTVHLDRVSGTKYGSGRSWTEIVAFVDGTCVAKGWYSIGIGGRRSWPAMVAVSPTTGLVVTGEGPVTVHTRRRKRGTRKRVSKEGSGHV